MRLLEIIKFVREVMSLLKEFGPELKEFIDLIRSFFPKTEEEKAEFRAKLTEAAQALKGE